MSQELENEIRKPCPNQDLIGFCQLCYTTHHGKEWREKRTVFDVLREHTVGMHIEAGEYEDMLAEIDEIIKFGLSKTRTSVLEEVVKVIGEDEIAPYELEPYNYNEKGDQIFDATSLRNTVRILEDNEAAGIRNIINRERRRIKHLLVSLTKQHE